mgnify:FL=1
MNTLELDGEKHLIMPHQLQVSQEETQIKASVLKSYFKGSHYLVEAEAQGQKIYFNTAEALKKDSLVYLKLKP